MRTFQPIAPSVFADLIQELRIRWHRWRAERAAARLEDALLVLRLQEAHARARRVLSRHLTEFEVRRMQHQRRCGA